jgi:phage repressor protein C with HTH and peptisase S24 domain
MIGTMGNRLKHALTQRGILARELIATTKLSKAAIYFILDDTTSPEKVRAETVRKICAALRLNRDWLLNGRGTMDAASQPDEDGWRDIRGYPQAAGLGAVGSEADEYAEAHKLKFRAESLRRKRLQPSNLSVFYGRGDSMLPRIHSGDAILFNTAETKPVDGAMFVIQVHGAANPEYQVKRAMILDDAVFFVADNPNGDHAWTKPKRMDAKRGGIEIIGRVRWIGSWED